MDEIALTIDREINRRQASLADLMEQQAKLKAHQPGLAEKIERERNQIVRLQAMLSGSPPWTPADTPDSVQLRQELTHWQAKTILDIIDRSDDQIRPVQKSLENMEKLLRDNQTVLHNLDKRLDLQQQRLVRLESELGDVKREIRNGHGQGGVDRLWIVTGAIAIIAILVLLMVITVRIV